jgi:hypothetical protein
MICLWFNFVIILTSLIDLWFYIVSSFPNIIYIFLTAYSWFSTTWVALNTSPNPPYPLVSIFLNILLNRPIYNIIIYIYTIFKYILLIMIKLFKVIYIRIIAFLWTFFLAWNTTARLLWIVNHIACGFPI